MTIDDSYRRLENETGRPCYSVTFWRTVNGFWGARAGIGSTEFGTTITFAIEAAVENAIKAQRERGADEQQTAGGEGMMHPVERERVEDVNRAMGMELNPQALEAAWDAFQNTPIDLLADSDDEQCRCMANAIKAYLGVLPVT